GDLLWLAPVEIGTPPQTLHLDLDTGSTDSWVFSTDTEPRNVKGQNLYHPGKSSTAELIDNCTWSIMYGDFSTSSGICYRDTFALGDIKIENMTIESATSASAMFTETSAMSGLVGLAWNYLAQTVPVQPCLMDFLPHVLKEPLFTVDFVHNGTGSFNFGFIDKSLHEGPLEYVDVDTKKGFWTVYYHGFRIAGDGIKYEFAKPTPVIVDTGSTLLFAPESAVKKYYDAVPGGKWSYEQYAYTLPCDKTPPDYIVEISDAKGNKVETTIPGQYVIYAHIDDKVCFGGIQSLGSFSSLEGILGDVYLKSGFAVFDIGGKKFGMASKPLDTDS
ncbi:aspartic peptidase domain-containing protein, partial [Microdochium bolleyi]